MLKISRIVESIVHLLRGYLILGSYSDGLGDPSFLFATSSRMLSRLDDSTSPLVPDIPLLL